MTDETRVIEVEQDGTVVFGKLVPFDVPSIVASHSPSGKLIVYREVWDRHSLTLPSGPVPLLQSHKDDHPIGRIAAGGLWIEPDGVMIEARLSGSASELEGIRNRVRDDVMAGLSIGFIGDKSADVWSAPTTAGGLPTVLRRGATIREGSLVVWPALTGAAVSRVATRTRAQSDSDLLLTKIRVERAVAERRREQAVAQRESVLELITRADMVLKPTVPSQPPSLPRRPEPVWQQFDADGNPNHPGDYPENGTRAQQLEWRRRYDGWIGTFEYQLRQELRRANQ